MCLRMNTDKRLKKTEMFWTSHISDTRIIIIRTQNPHIFHAVKIGFSQKLTAFLQKFWLTSAQFRLFENSELRRTIIITSRFEKLCFCVYKHIWEKLGLIRSLITMYECLRSSRMWRRVTGWFMRSNSLIFEGGMSILRGKSTFKMRPIHYLEMSGTNDSMTRHHIPEKRRLELWFYFIESDTRLTMRPICFTEMSKTHHSDMRCHNPEEQKHQLHCCESLENRKNIRRFVCKW
jgi:hypothetical protein